jgi:phage antirepressor YoqD-like protein
MAIPDTGSVAGLFTIDEAAHRLDIEPGQLLTRLLRAGFLYRYTGIGRPLAYVRWVRAGLFVNKTEQVCITKRGLAFVTPVCKVP